ncbi:MAG TPA: sugar phosphate nucleotidyltransferase [Burkholderiales bacterium]|nr:sugar phosphate nucleotidyltransferase [Burkholderiales bacterium]
MKMVALVLAGGEGTRLYPLTAEHAKPALPFANGYRIVDFVLSNLVNSKISNIYVLAQYKPESLMRHIANAWAPWFSDGEGVIKVLLPRSNRQLFRGTADAVSQYIDLLQAHAPDVVAIFAADHIYRMDVRQMADFHVKRDADVTVSAVAVPIEKCFSFGILSTDNDARVREFREKPKHAAPIAHDPAHAYASMGNYLFDAKVLERVLEEGRSRGDTDFGRDILPRLCQSARVYAYDFAQNEVPGLQDFEERAYWRDVGTLSALAAAQQDAMGHRPRFNLWNRRWPIRGEYDAALLAKIRGWRSELEAEPVETIDTPSDVSAAPAWRAAGKELRTDERLQPS